MCVLVGWEGEEGGWEGKREKDGTQTVGFTVVHMHHATLVGSPGQAAPMRARRAGMSNDLK